MPLAYERERDALIARGVPEKKAKSEAAATWNKRNPNDTNPWLREKGKKAFTGSNPYRKS